MMAGDNADARGRVLRRTSTRLLLLGALLPSAEAKAALSRRAALARTGTALGAALLGGRPVLLPPPAWSAVSAPPFCDEAVDVLVSPTRKIYLCGTAHISEESALLVRDLVRTVRPSSVMIELDRARFDSMMAAPVDGKKKRSDSDLLRGLWTDLRSPGTLGERIGRAQSNAIGRSLSQLYESMEGLGFQAGDEFKVAAVEALNSGAQLVLGDQDVRTTLDALRDSLSRTDIRALLTSPTIQLADGTEMAVDGGNGNNAALDKASVSAMVATLKERQNTRAIVGALELGTPALYDALIAQRDAFMAKSLDAAKGPVIVGVVGMAHLDGIGRNLMANDPTLRIEPKRGCPAVMR